MVPKIVVLNGPSLNLLGTREPEVYGTTTLEEIEAMCRKRAGLRNLDLTFFRQTNHEGFLIDWIHEARSLNAAIVINPGAWLATSVAIADALKISQSPVVEVHLSNIHRREWSHNESYVSKVAKGVVAGFGYHSYLYAIDAQADLLAPR
ncbi:type II 3-dehydroquinate dehydratase [Aquamicrobium sp. LC103]|uniref:type II 3-dehydroquinate dehydratase n=1 Tax=Aquamicrobium sp. LC103 TaxID=1120658 RepID=UPI00063E8DEC|nr:type II 3-dehydroquinate dehydratase [Aquamicrobium sp. LC103]TKT69512.1 3-dehydroquinate dehydratase [Aquamicrobium sp. LC103]